MLKLIPNLDSFEFEEQLKDENYTKIFMANLYVLRNILIFHDPLFILNKNEFMKRKKLQVCQFHVHCQL